MDTEVYCNGEERELQNRMDNLDFYSGGETLGVGTPRRSLAIQSKTQSRGQTRALDNGHKSITNPAKVGQLKIRMADGVLVTFFSLLLFPPTKGSKG